MTAVTDKERIEFEIKAPYSRSLDIQLAELDKQIATPLPTPPLGYTVGWLATTEQVTERNTYVAIVIAIHEPGVLRLHVLSELRNRDADGSRYVGHPSLAGKSKNRVGDAGLWFYLGVLEDPNYKPPKEHFKAFNDDMARRRRGLLESEKKRQVDAAERAKVEELQKNQGVMV